MDQTTLESRLVEEVAQEVDRLKRDARMTWIVGFIVGLFCLTYFTVIYNMFSTLTAPESVAILAREAFEENAEDLFFQAETELKKQALPLASRASDLFIQTVPRLAEEGKSQIDYAIEEMIPQTSSDMQVIVTNYLHDNAATLEALAQMEDNDAAVQAFVSDLMAEWGRQFDARLAAETQGTHNARYVLDNTLIGLQAMNAHLDYLMAKQPGELTREEALQLRILASLIRSVTSEP